MITEGPSGTINYNTITFKWAGAYDSNSPLKLTFSSYLDGYDRDYSPFTPETSRTYKNLAEGNYTFYVKAQDENGNIERTPASQSYTIAAVPPGQAAPVIVPGGTGGVLLIGSDVSRIVVGSDGATLYALDSLNSRLYRSDTAGMDWTDITGKVGGGPLWVDIAVAPDDPGLVAVATDNGREVRISDDYGATFSTLGFSSVIGAGQAARSISISPDYGAPGRDIAVGTWSGMANGRVYINILTRFPSGWFDASSSAPGWLNADIFAIKFSPSYAADGTLLCVASSPAKTYLFAGLRDLGSVNTVWNSLTGYPVELCKPGSGTSGTPLNYADITLPADYNGSNPYSRHVFVSWSKNHPSQGVYHVVDFQPYSMNAPEPISTIAYYGTIGRGKLLAGAARCISGGGCYQVQTYFTANPTSNYPTWQPSQKPPTGQRDARVGWSTDGKMAYAGTSGTESALSHSRSNGYTWNQ